MRRETHHISRIEAATHIVCLLHQYYAENEREIMIINQLSIDDVIIMVKGNGRC